MLYPKKTVLHEKNTVLHAKNTVLYLQNTMLYPKNTVLQSKNTMLHAKNTVLHAKKIHFLAGSELKKNKTKDKREAREQKENKYTFERRGADYFPAPKQLHE